MPHGSPCLPLARLLGDNFEAKSFLFCFLIQTEEEKQIEVGFLRLLRMNSREWPYVALGVLCAAGTGAVMPLFAELLGSVIAALQPSEPASTILKFSILFWGLGVIQLCTVTVQVCTLDKDTLHVLAFLCLQEGPQVVL